MNWLDAVILLVVLWFGANAYRAGLIKEVVTCAALAVGVVVAGLYYDGLAAQVFAFLGGDWLPKVVAFLLLFGSVMLLGQLTAFILRGLASLLLLGWADRVLGAGLGVFKGLLLVEVLLVVFVTFPGLGLEGAVRHSLLGPPLLGAAQVVVSLLPSEFEAAVRAPPVH